MSRLIRFGIDLGTTNSCIALCEGTDVRVFPNNDQMNVTPSVVRILKSGRLIVGSRAYHALRDDPDNIATEFKRWMGQSDKRSFPASGRLMSAEELSAEVLKSLREDVRRLTSEDIDAAVVTVPAAFGALQCEATARAARLAGLLESPLLQEPIAAAIAYGITPGARDQKWMIFDLGGGTLDIAIVSTKAGRLAVLEHQGNNLLGGKDIDRGLVEKIFLPCLADGYSLPDPTLDRRGYDCLIRRLVRKAEETKIELSTSNEVVVSLVDLGEDEEGSKIEAEIILTRDQLEDEIQPMLKECLKLAEAAVAGAHLTGSDIDRILLVGGPTQMPILRRSLEERIGAPVDFSLDPMTVVARGAAIYAASIERTVPSTRPPAVSDKLAIKLAFEPVSASVQCPVTGMIEKAPEVGNYEVKIDSDSGYWSSGWLSANEGFFEIIVMLQEGKENRFWLYVRDRTGRIIDCEPSQLSIRHGLEVGAPPLPHTISIEIVDSKGRPVLEPVFIRNTPLPSKQAKKYRASHALRPGEPDTSIAIKLWEGEEFADPEANSWVGNMLIKSEDLRRVIPEGAEIEVFIKIDNSRLISVEAFVPYLNQHFSEHVYVAQREERDFALLAESVPGQVNEHRQRWSELEVQLAGEDNGRTHEELQEIETEIDELDQTSEFDGTEATAGDPDRAKRLVEKSRRIRGRLAQLERRAKLDRGKISQDNKIEMEVTAAQEVVEKFGSALDKREFQMLQNELNRSAGKDDDRGLQKAFKSINSLRWRVLFKQDWFWKEIFDGMCEPKREFINNVVAQEWLAKGAEATSQGDGEGLREAVRQLWKLQPPDQADVDQEQALRSGLKRY